MDRQTLFGGVLSTEAHDESHETRIGLIGVGPWGRNYVRTIQAMDEVEIAAAVSRNPTTPEIVGSLCRIYPTWQDLFEAGGVDGIILATPPTIQAPIAEAAMRQSLPILFEKPIALTTERANELTELAGSKAAIAHVDHIDLCNPALRALREHIDNPSAISALRGAWSNQGPVRVDVRGLWDYGAHAVAVCLDLMDGEPDRVDGAWLNHTRETELATVRLHWNNVSADLEIGNGGAHRARWLEIDIADHRLRYDDIAHQKAAIDNQEIDYPNTSPLSVAVRRFVAAIQRGEPDLADLQLGAAAVRTLAAVQNVLEASS